MQETALKRFAVLAELTDSEISELAGNTEPVTLPRGAYLFREGEPGDSLYFLTGGILVAERLVDAEAGEKKDLAIFPPLSCVGEMALADSAPRSATLRAELPCQALKLPLDRFEGLMNRSPTIALKLFRAFFSEASRRLRATNDQLVAVYEVGRLVASSAAHREVAETVLRSLMGRLVATRASVALYDQPSNQLVVRRAIGQKADALEGQHIPLDQGLPARAFDERKPLLVERMLGLSEVWESESMILAPLVDRSTPLGLLLLGAPEGNRAYGVSDLSLASAVANISARVLAEAYSQPIAAR